MSTVFKVNGSDVPVPNTFKWGLQDVSDPDAGRTLDGVMHKNRIAQKVKLELAWKYRSNAEMSTILKAFNDEYFNVTYRDPKENAVVTKKFYRGDASTNMYSWEFNGGLSETISFNVIEV